MKSVRWPGDSATSQVRTFVELHVTSSGQTDQKVPSTLVPPSSPATRGRISGDWCRFGWGIVEARTVFRASMRSREGDRAVPFALPFAKRTDLLSAVTEVWSRKVGDCAKPLLQFRIQTKHNKTV